MTILSPATAATQAAEPLLTPFDILDAYAALNNAACPDTYQLSPADQQALSLLTYWDGLDEQQRADIAWLLTGPRMFPVNRTDAAILMRIAADLPPVTRDDENAWAAARLSNTLDVVLETLATYTADHSADVDQTRQVRFLGADWDREAHIEADEGIERQYTGLCGLSLSERNRLTTPTGRTLCRLCGEIADNELYDRNEIRKFYPSYNGMTWTTTERAAAVAL
jgi:hypothetical protein